MTALLASYLSILSLPINEICVSSEKFWLSKATLFPSDFRAKFENLMQSNYSKKIYISTKMGDERVFVKITRFHNGETRKSAEREARNIRYFNGNPYIVQMKECIFGETFIAVILEYLESDLFEYIKKSPPSLAERKRVIVEMGRCVEEVHSHELVYGDFKFENLMFSDPRKLTLKLIDLESLGAPGFRRAYGTLPYNPPEYFTAVPRYLGQKQDAWSYALLSAIVLNDLILTFHNKAFKANLELNELVVDKLREHVRLFLDRYHRGYTEIVLRGLNAAARARPSVAAMRAAFEIAERQPKTANLGALKAIEDILSNGKRGNRPRFGTKRRFSFGGLASII